MATENATPDTPITDTDRLDWLEKFAPEIDLYPSRNRVRLGWEDDGPRYTYAATLRLATDVGITFTRNRAAFIRERAAKEADV